MKAKGKITSWYDEKGYGFISPLTGGERTFVHIRAFANRTRRPAVGDTVTYAVVKDSLGRFSAQKAAIVGLPTLTRPGKKSAALSQAIAVTFLLTVLAAAAVSVVPVVISAAYLVVSLVTYAAYALDKKAAAKGDSRTSESRLHVLALAGGWPGALIAQSRLRHKTRKQPFRAIFWATVILNCSAVYWLLEGASPWQ